MPSLSPQQFKFRKNDSVGAAAAEDDSFLRDCFHDTGYLQILRDTNSLERIVVGRTGSGKSALLLRLRDTERHCSCLDPHDLALQYLSNSTILQELSALGVNLDPFYKLLWKHVLIVEFIKLRYPAETEKERENAFQHLWELFERDKVRKEALEYFRNWNQNFWKETEYRVKELTNKLEENVSASLGADFAKIKANFGTQGASSIQEKTELVHRLQRVVDTIQIAQLNRFVELLANEVFDKEEPRYYIVIDKLDENWVDNSVRFKLIRALIETVRDLKRLVSTKILVSLRVDLLERVIENTRDEGFQEEKYRDFYLQITWLGSDLLEVLDKRINKLVQRSYTGGNVALRDILPATVGAESIEDYLIDRTMYRPRDILEFFNYCIQRSTHNPTIGLTVLREAESTYSRSRLRSLQDEWVGDFPVLTEFYGILRGKPPKFTLSTIDQKELAEKCLNVTISGDKEGELFVKAKEVAQGHVEVSSFVPYLVRIFYMIGLIGLKTDGAQSAVWNYRDRLRIGVEELDGNTEIHISPIFYRGLGTVGA